MIVFPAVFLGDVELLHSLKDIDPDEVLILCTGDYAEFCNLQRNYLVDDFRDVRSLLRKIEDWCRTHGRKLDGVMGIDDETHFRITKAIADHFELPFYDTTTLDVASDKLLMKQQFLRHGVPTSKFARLASLDGAAVRAVGFPSVLKPVCGSGSNYIFLNRSEEELTRNFSLLQRHLATSDDPRLRPFHGTLDGEAYAHDPRREFLLEAYVGGDEYSCDFVLQRQTLQILRVVKKYRSPHLGLFSGYYLLHPDSLEAFGVRLAELQQVCGRIAAALRIAEGVCMVDFKVEDGRLQVIETSIRPGLSLFIPLMQTLYGYTSLGVLSRLRRGLDVRVATPRQEGLCVILYAPRGGTITTLDLTPLRECSPTLDVLDIYCYNRPGDRVADSPFDHMDLHVGYVLVRVTERERGGELLELVQNRVRIEVSDGPV